ncbi:hypothetical protein MMC14_002463 [Varicellaria rhodocarpa]|nr:hypothetical protein [Varicellaria rhodocarpa]
MGKRKKSSRKPQGPKKKEPLPTSFPCLFCNHDKSVSVKLEKKAGTGELSCKVCGQQFQTGINYLSAAVDVYSDWIDACDAVAKEAAGLPKDNASSSYADQSGMGGRRNMDTQIDKHSVPAVEDDEDGQGDYDDE